MFWELKFSIGLAYYKNLKRLNLFISAELKKNGKKNVSLYSRNPRLENMDKSNTHLVYFFINSVGTISIIQTFGADLYVFLRKIDTTLSIALYLDTVLNKIFLYCSLILFTSISVYILSFMCVFQTVFSLIVLLLRWLFVLRYAFSFYLLFIVIFLMVTLVITRSLVQMLCYIV